MQALLCLLWGASVTVMVNRGYGQLTGAQLGRDAGTWLPPGLAGHPCPPKNPNPHFSPRLLGRGCLVQQRRGAERDGLLAGLSALAQPLSPCWLRAAERATCPWSCMLMTKAAKLPRESLAVAHCHCSGHSLGASGVGQQCLHSSPSAAGHCLPLASSCSFSLAEGYVCKDLMRDGHVQAQAAHLAFC